MIARCLTALLLFVGLCACGMDRHKAYWTADTRAPLDSHIVVAGDAVLIPDLSDDRDSVLSCFAAADGSLRWQVPLEDFLVANAMGSVFAVADPEGTTVYLAHGTQMAGFSVADGAPRWNTMVPKQEPFEDFTIGTPPVVVGDRVYLLSRHCRAVAVDRRNGELVFRTDDLEQADLMTVRDGAVITRAYEDKNLAAHDAQTGDPLWKRVVTAPFQITTRLETSLRLAPDTGPYLFFDERTLLALDPRSGAVRWQEPVIGLASYASAGAVVVVTDSASVRGIDPRTGAVRWRHPTGGLSFVAPLDDTTALLALQGAVCTVDAGTGAIRKHARHQLHEQDGVIEARNGLAVISTDNGIARFYWRDGRKLVERSIGETLPRISEPRARVGITKATISRKSVFTFNHAREIHRYVR
jgi:outer membrane protein assembly factor BamB